MSASSEHLLITVILTMPQMLLAAATLWAAIRGWKQGQENHRMIDGRMDELLRASAARSRQEGREQGQGEERERQEGRPRNPPAV